MAYQKHSKNIANLPAKIALFGFCRLCKNFALFLLCFCYVKTFALQFCYVFALQFCNVKTFALQFCYVFAMQFCYVKHLLCSFAMFLLCSFAISKHLPCSFGMSKHYVIGLLFGVAGLRISF